MSERLQKNARKDRTISAPVRSTEIILDNNYFKKVIEFIYDADQEIRIAMYNFRLYPDAPEKDIHKLYLELVMAQRRGVRVSCLVEQRSNALELQNAGIAAKYVRNKRSMHLKCLLIDRDTLIVGSHNLTDSGLNSNYEASIATHDFEVCEQFRRYFDVVWEKYAESK